MQRPVPRLREGREDPLDLCLAYWDIKDRTSSAKTTNHISCIASASVIVFNMSPSNVDVLIVRGSTDMPHLTFYSLVDALRLVRGRQVSSQHLASPRMA